MTHSWHDGVDEKNKVALEKKNSSTLWHAEVYTRWWQRNDAKKKLLMAATMCLLRVRNLPSPIRTVRQSYQVLKTFSSSIASDMNSLGVQSINSPRVNFLSPPPTTGKSRT